MVQKKRKKGKEVNEPLLRSEMEYLKKHIDKLWEQANESADRLQSIEIHLNLLTRLLTALCIEKMGMRIGVLKRLIKRIEKEAIQESQIYQLESLYKLHHYPAKKPHPHKSDSEDRWEDIS